MFVDISFARLEGSQAGLRSLPEKSASLNCTRSLTCGLGLTALCHKPEGSSGFVACLDGVFWLLAKAKSELYLGRGLG